jgi:hypothetical protein
MCAHLEHGRLVLSLRLDGDFHRQLLKALELLRDHHLRRNQTQILFRCDQPQLGHHTREGLCALQEA